MHKVVMNYDTDQEKNIENHDFDRVVHRFKLKNKPAYSFLLVKPKVEYIFTNFNVQTLQEIHKRRTIPSFFLADTLLKQLWRKASKHKKESIHMVV